METIKLSVYFTSIMEALDEVSAPVVQCMDNAVFLGHIPDRVASRSPNTITDLFKQDVPFLAKHLYPDWLDWISFNPESVRLHTVRLWSSMMDMTDVAKFYVFKRALVKALGSAAHAKNTAFIQYIVRKYRIPMAQVLNDIIGMPCYEGHRNDIQETVEYLCSTWKIKLESTAIERILYTKDQDAELESTFYVALPAMENRILVKTMLTCAVYGFRNTATLMYNEAIARNIVKHAQHQLYADLMKQRPSPDEPYDTDPVLILLRCQSQGIPLPERHLNRAISMAVGDKDLNALNVLYSLRDTKLIDRSTNELIEFCYYVRQKQMHSVRSRLMSWNP